MTRIVLAASIVTARVLRGAFVTIEAQAPCTSFLARFFPYGLRLCLSQRNPNLRVPRVETPHRVPDTLPHVSSITLTRSDTTMTPRV